MLYVLGYLPMISRKQNISLLLYASIFFQDRTVFVQWVQDLPWSRQEDCQDRWQGKYGLTSVFS